MLLAPFVTAIVGSSILGLFPGTTGFILGAIFGALAKGLAGLKQNPNSTEDLLMFFITFLGLLGTTVSSNPDFAIVGLILGSIAKAIPSLLTSPNEWEDIFLFLGAVITAIGLGVNIPALIDVGLLLSIFGKTIPSLGITTTPVVVAPVPTPTPAV